MGAPKRCQVTNMEVLRRQQGWTVKEFAARVGCSHQTVWLWESGKSIPRYHDVVSSILELFPGWSMEELVSPIQPRRRP